MSSDWPAKKLVDSIKDAGVVYFTYCDLNAVEFGCFDEGPLWHWDIYDKNPRKYIKIPVPWSFRFGWYDKGNPNRWIKWFPLGGAFYDYFFLMYYNKKVNQGCGNSLKGAFDAYRCESNGNQCTVTDCDYYKDCMMESTDA